MPQVLACTPVTPNTPQVPAPLSAWALGLPPLSRFLSTGFLRGSFVGVSALLYLEGFLFAIYSLNRVPGLYLFIFIFFKI